MYNFHEEPMMLIEIGIVSATTFISHLVSKKEKKSGDFSNIKVAHYEKQL